MSLIQKIYNVLGKNLHSTDGVNITTLVEQEPQSLKIMSDILGVPFVNTEKDFEDNYLADLVKYEKESDGDYENRLTKLNERKLIPAINKETQKKIIFCVDPTSEELDYYCNYDYGLMSLSTYKQITGLDSSLSIVFDENEEMPVYIRKLFKSCYENKASDIDFTSMQSTIAVKLKISGEWDVVSSIPIVYKNKFLIALCSMANPNPLDYKSGRELKLKISQNIDGINVLFRNSVMPSTFGESIVIRKVSSIGTLPEISKLNFSDEAIEFVKNLVELIFNPEKGGLVFINGKTGSGKTTLLAAIINLYLSMNIKVNTAEDPVEIKHPHPYLNQIEVGEETGLTYLKVIVGLMRQAPDVIVIGESREAEEIKSVVNAALSGHFTYTSFHAGNAEQTLGRFVTMGIDLSMVVAPLKAIVSMNLIPKLCDSCKIKHEGKYIRREKEGNTCEACRGRGILGTVPILEAAPFDNPNIKKLVGVEPIYKVIEEVKKEKTYISFESQFNRLKELGLVDCRSEMIHYSQNGGSK